MHFVQTEIPGVIVVEPDIFRDPRGYFLETYHETKYRAAGIEGPFRQDNRSWSVHNTLRGLHLQVRHPQAKLVQVIEGEILDVAVDLRSGSPTFGRWVAVILSSDNCRQCYVPAGFAHGFYVMSRFAHVEYKCTELYDAESEVGICWNDPELAITWPTTAPLLSERDRKHPNLAEIRCMLSR